MIKKESRQLRILTYIFLIAIIIVAVYFRLIKNNSPYTGLHGWNEANWAELGRLVAKGYVIPIREGGGFDWAVPPLYAWILGIFFFFFGVSESVSRILSVFFSILTLCFLYLTCRVIYDKKISLTAVLFASFTPLCVYFGRNTGLESPMMLFAMSGLWFFMKWWKIQSDKNFWIAGILFGLGIAVRYHLLVILTPLLIKLCSKFVKEKEYKRLFNFYFITLLPTILWVVFVAFNGVLGEIFSYATKPSVMSGASSRGSPFNFILLFQPFFYEKIFVEYMLNQITIPLIILCLVGILSDMPSDKNQPIYLFFAGSILLLFVFPLASYIHDYYQYALAHMVDIFAAVGLFSLGVKKNVKPLSKKLLTVVIIIIVCITFFEAQSEIYYLYSINESDLSVEVAAYLRQHTLPTDYVVVSDRVAAYYVERSAYVWLELYDVYSSNQVIEVLETKHPKYVIFPKWEKDLGLITDKELFKYLYSNYHGIADIKGCFLLKSGMQFKVDFKKEPVDMYTWNLFNTTLTQLSQSKGGLNISLAPSCSGFGGIISVPIYCGAENVSLAVNITDVFFPDQGFANWFVALAEDSGTYIGVNNWNKGKQIRLIKCIGGIIEDLWVSPEGDWSRGELLINKKNNTYEVYMNGVFITSKFVDKPVLQNIRVLIGVYMHSQNEQGVSVLYSSLTLNKNDK
jgi:4-amino-4-deoxy-L-arabinose transferase-like glycosyltransferase